MNSSSFFKAFREQIMLSVNTSYPAKVLSFDEDNLEAKIQPLFMSKNFNEEPESLDAIDGIPLLKQNYRVNGSSVQSYVPVVSRGDIVLCVVASRSLDDATSGNAYYPGNARIMNLQDSVIVGVVK